jgi:hypothetical protein
VGRDVAANAVFGFDGWSRETLMLEQLHPPVLVPDAGEGEMGLVVSAYAARVRITVYACDRVIVREGCGAARGLCPHLWRGVRAGAEGRGKRCDQACFRDLRQRVWLVPVRSATVAIFLASAC